jgi:cytochrome o ubiquinol oxidase operon protein cyoD
MANKLPATLHSSSDYGTGKKTFGIYLTGIILCIILTLIPFMGTIYHTIPKGWYFFTFYSCAIIQLLVQVKCFLRMNTATEQSRTNIMTFLFTLVILFVIIGGSMWIMVNLDYNMM